MNKQHLKYALIQEYQKSKGYQDYRNSVKQKLYTNNKTIFNFQNIFMNNLKFKLLITIPVLAASSLLVIGAANPAVAQNIRRCGINLECYEKNETFTNKYGGTVQLQRIVDENQNMTGMTVQMTNDQQATILEKLGGKRMSESNGNLVYELSSGSRVTIKKDGVIEWGGAYMNDWDAFHLEAFGPAYERNPELAKNKSDERAKTLETLKSIQNPHTSNDATKETYFRGIAEILIPEFTTDKDVRVYKFHGTIYKYKINDTHQEIYDLKSGALLFKLKLTV